MPASFALQHAAQSIEHDIYARRLLDLPVEWTNEIVYPSYDGLSIRNIPHSIAGLLDAPLDDANVQRYCNLVKELSEQVQFIYITHNKLAMTMATDLLGVTMPEPGTSKLVTVNLLGVETDC